MAFTKMSSKFAKGETTGTPVFTGGRRVRFIGLPVTPEGKVVVNGYIGFQGAFESASAFFTVNDYNGAALQIQTKATQLVGHVPNSLGAHKAVLPIRTPELFEGIPMLIPVLLISQAEEITIDFYLE